MPILVYPLPLYLKLSFSIYNLKIKKMKGCDSVRTILASQVLDLFPSSSIGGFMQVFNYGYFMVDIWSHRIEYLGTVWCISGLYFVICPLCALLTYIYIQISTSTVTPLPTYGMRGM